MTIEEKKKAMDALRISTPIMAMTQEKFGDYIHSLNQVMDWLEQEPKTGHWIRWDEQKENDYFIEHIPHCKCSECGKEYDSHSSQFIKYCNECGAKMVESQECSDVVEDSEYKKALKQISKLQKENKILRDRIIDLSSELIKQHMK